MKGLVNAGSFLLKLIAAIVFLVLASKFGQLQTVFIVFTCIGLLVLSIATDFMGEHSGVARVVIFLLGAALLIIPSFVQNILIIKQSTNYYKEALFLLSATLLFSSWLSCGEMDISGAVPGLIFLGGTIFASVIIKFIFYTWNMAILFLVAGIIILIIMLITFFVKGSALLY